jgi:hypothetical protein
VLSEVVGALGASIKLKFTCTQDLGRMPPRHFLGWRGVEEEFLEVMERNMELNKVSDTINNDGSAERHVDCIVQHLPSSTLSPGKKEKQNVAAIARVSTSIPAAPSRDQKSHGAWRPKLKGKERISRAI